MQHNFRMWKADGQVENDLAIQRNLSIYKKKGQQTKPICAVAPQEEPGIAGISYL